MRDRRPALLAGLPLLLLATGCNLLSPPPGGNVPHPTGSEVVVRIEWTGGFVPYEYLFTSLPRFTLLGDGRVLVEGPQIELYPGPALPNIQVRRVTEEGVQSILFRIAETELFDQDRSYTGAAQFVADANTTVFTVTADDRTVVVDVYALGIATPDSVPAGFPAEELAAHQALLQLEADLMNLDAWLPADDWADTAWQSYQAEALLLLVADVTELPPVDPGFSSDPLPWPGTTPPTALGDPSDVHDFRCGVVSGAEADTWLVALAEANELTRWSYDGRLYRVTPRPLLPDEPLTCAWPEG